MVEVTPLPKPGEEEASGMEPNQTNQSVNTGRG